MSSDNKLRGDRDIERLEFLWNVHSYLNECIKFADTKAELVIAWATALIGCLVAAGIGGRLNFRSPLGIAGVLGLVFLFLAFASAFMAVTPRLKASGKNGYIFWMGIAAHGSSENFTSALAGLTGNELHEHLCQHIYELASICVAKYYWIRVSIACAFAGSVISSIAYVVGS